MGGRGCDFQHFLHSRVFYPHLEEGWPSCQQFRHLKGLGIDCLTRKLKAAIFTLTGIGEEKVRITVSERISGCPFIGSRFTWVTFCDESAARISSSLSGMGTPKVTPLQILEEIEVTGSVHEIALPATSVKFMSISRCSLETGRAERSPPCNTSESLTSPASSLRARWNASRSPKDMALKLGG